MSVVLDASALLAYLWQEPGHEQVAACLEEGNALMSAVNVCEVFSRAIDRGMSAQDVSTLTHALGLDVRPFDAAQSIQAARLREFTRQAGLSLGDRACLALAQQLGFVALTADRAWAQCPNLGVQIQLLR
jgi:ribonuclease VapC